MLVSNRSLLQVSGSLLDLVSVSLSGLELSDLLLGLLDVLKQWLALLPQELLR